MPYQAHPNQVGKATLADFAAALRDDGGLGKTLRFKETPAAEGRQPQAKLSQSRSLPIETSRAKDERRQQEGKAVDVIKTAIDRQLGEGSGQAVFDAAGLGEARKLTGRDLNTLETALAQTVAQHIATPERPSVQTLKEKSQQQTPPQSKAAAGTLEDLLQDPSVSWRVADSGSGGALLASKPDGTGVVVKIESFESVQKAAAVSQVLGTAYGNRPGGIAVANITNESGNEPGLTALETKLADMKASLGENDPKRQVIDKHLENLGKRKTQAADATEQNPAQALGVSKMDFLPGKQLNNVSLLQRTDLVESGTLARALGQNTVIGTVSGLCDHAPFTTDDVANPINMSNFMYDEATGNLAPHDYDTKMMALGEDGSPPKFGTARGGKVLSEVSEFAEKAVSSPEAFDKFLNNSIKDASDGRQRTPLCGVMQAIASPHSCESTFSPEEAPLVEGLLQDEGVLRKQAICALDGLLIQLEQDQAAEIQLKQAVEDGNGLSQADMDQYSTALQGKNFGEMRNQLERHAEAHGVKLHNTAAQQANLEAIRGLAEKNNVNLQAAELADANGNARSPKAMRDVAANKGINADSFRERGDEMAEKSPAEAKLAYLKADREQALGTAIKEAAELLEHPGHAVSAADLESLDQKFLAVAELTEKFTQEESLQNEQRMELYQSEVSAAVTPVLEQEGFSPEEIGVFTEAAVKLGMEAESAALQNNEATAKLFAGQLKEGLEACPFKYSDHNPEASKLHDALYRANNTNAHVHLDGDIEIKRGHASFQSATADRILGEVAEAKEVALTPVNAAVENIAENGPANDTGVPNVSVPDAGQSEALDAGEPSQIQGQFKTAGPPEERKPSVRAMLAGHRGAAAPVQAPDANKAGLEAENQELGEKSELPKVGKVAQLVAKFDANPAPPSLKKSASSNKAG